MSSGPETAGSKTAYSYVNSGGSPPYQSHSTVDQMGIDAMPQPGSSAQLGAEYQGNGELCWVAQVTTSSGTCSNPAGSATNYETVSYNSSGDMTGTAATGYGNNSALSWNVDTNEPSCINPAGTSCTGPSSSQPAAKSYTYNADGLRTTAQSWNSSTSSVVTTDFTWNTGASALLSNGTFDYLYGRNPNVPIGQVDTADGYTGELLTDPSSSVRGIVEVSSGSANPYVVDNYTDYDAYGNPMSGSGGSINPGGLTVDGKTGDADSASSYGFGGGYLDTSTFVYLLHRYYEPSLGSFLSVDPDLSNTSSPFVYVLDDPANATDVSGMHGWYCIAGHSHKLANNWRMPKGNGRCSTTNVITQKIREAPKRIYRPAEACVANEPCYLNGRCIMLHLGDPIPYGCMDAVIDPTYKPPPGWNHGEDCTKKGAKIIAGSVVAGAGIGIGAETADMLALAGVANVPDTAGLSLIVAAFGVILVGGGIGGAYIGVC